METDRIIDLTYCPSSPIVTLICLTTKQEIKTDEEVVFNYVRGQIARWQYEDWIVEYKGKIYNIDKEGQIQNWPDGLFDQNENLVSYVVQHGILREEYDDDLRKNLIDVDVLPEIV